MEYQVEIRDITSVDVISIRFNGKYSDMGKHIGSLYKAAKNNNSGAPFALYHDDDYKEEADIELCVPTKKLIAVTDGNITSKTLPAIKATCVTHKGGYDRLNLAYKALLDYAKSENLILQTPSREVYTKGPGVIFRGNENNYITEIITPFQEQED